MNLGNPGHEGNEIVGLVLVSCAAKMLGTNLDRREGSILRNWQWRGGNRHKSGSSAIMRIDSLPVPAGRFGSPAGEMAEWLKAAVC